MAKTGAVESGRITGFAPILGAEPRVLILGSMPSVASLDKHQYYGKPQNAFWRIMGELFGAGPELPYEERTRMLTEQQVAVWDVLASCVRPGSLDSAIEKASEQANDFATLLQQCPTIEHIFFNGRKSEEVFRRRVLPGIAELHGELAYTSLPSTSPAMASLNFAAKLELWRSVAVVLRNPTN